MFNLLEKPATVPLASYSGGKDSTAMATLLVETGLPFRLMFADTGNEHPWTVEYVKTLHEKLDCPPVEIVQQDFTEAQFDQKRKFIREKWPEHGVSEAVCERALKALKRTGNPFLDVCQLRAGFPASKGRFCTHRLKVAPIHEQVYEPLWDQGMTVLNFQGIRREESPARRDLGYSQFLSPDQADRKENPYLPKGDHLIVRPLIDWTLADVWKQHRRHNIEPNPLYKHGMTRVGCMPCIFVKKQELRVIGERFPERIDRIEEWEAIVDAVSKQLKHAPTTFLPARNLPEYAALKREATVHEFSGRYDEDTGEEVWEDVFHPELMPEFSRDAFGIRTQVKWAGTTHGGRQYSLIPISEMMPDLTEDCASWGACELSKEPVDQFRRGRYAGTL